MKDTFITFSALEDNFIQIIQDDEDLFIIKLKEDLHLLPYKLFKYFSNIKIKPRSDTYLTFTIPTEEPIPTYLTTIPALDDNANLLSFYLYNISGKELILKKDTTIGYIRVTKALLVDRDIAYYSNKYILVRELMPNTIKNFSYVIDPDGKHSLVFRLNRRFFENPFAIEIPLDNNSDNKDK